MKRRLQDAGAVGTFRQLILRGSGGSTVRLPCNYPAFRTRQERLPPFYRKNGNEKQGKIVVHPFHPGPEEATGGADHGLVIQKDGFLLHAADEEEHGNYSQR